MTVIELLAAALLFLGSALIIRAAIVSDLSDPTVASRPKGETTPDESTSEETESREVESEA